MLGALAVALALTSPLPLPRPAADAPAAVADTVAIAAPEAAAALPREGSAVDMPPLPVERPATEAAAKDAAQSSTASIEAGGDANPEPAVEAPSDRKAGDAAVPVPAERPAPVVAGQASDAVAPQDGDEHAAPVDDAPRPAARPQRALSTAGDAPVIKAMLTPDSTPPRGHGGLTAPRDMVCRDPRLVGAPAASFAGKIPGCGIFEPVRVASISGIRMSAPVTVDCRTARALADWLTGVAQPAARETMNSKIAALWIMGSYSCRTRNNQPGKRLSEHSAGRAVDLGGITLANGRRLNVRDDWGNGAAGDFLRRIREGACGGFTTVLGPGSDRHHHNHLHLDTAYRSSTYCR